MTALPDVSITATASLPTTKPALAMSPRILRRLHLIAPLMHEHAWRDFAEFDESGAGAAA